MGRWTLGTMYSQLVPLFRGPQDINSPLEKAWKVSCGIFSVRIVLSGYTSHIKYKLPYFS